MWQILNLIDQLKVGSKLQKKILDGDASRESIFQVTKIGDIYFFIKFVQQDSEILEDSQQLEYYFEIDKIHFLGLKFWI